MKIKTKNTKLLIKKVNTKASCGKRGCEITLLPTYIQKERLQEYKKAS